MRTCSKCGHEKPATEEFFYRDRGYLTSPCRECRKERMRQYAKVNREAANERLRRFRKRNPGYDGAHRTEEQRASDLARVLAWNKANRERILALQREKRATRADYQERLLDNRHRRRAKKNGVKAERISFVRILAQFGMICHLCGGDIAEGELHWDHVVPLSRGGEHVESNIRPAHAACNLRKHNKLISAA